MAIKWCPRIKILSPSFSSESKYIEGLPFDLNIEQLIPLAKHGLIGGVQINLAHPKMMYDNEQTEAYVIERLQEIGVPLVIHGPAGGAGFDITDKFREFPETAKLIERVGEQDSKSFNYTSAEYALNMASELDNLGMLGLPNVILHPGFALNSTMDRDIERVLAFLSNLKGEKERIVFETVPWYHTTKLDNEVLSEQLSYCEKLRDKQVYVGIGGTPENMELFLNYLSSNGFDMKIFPDFTHMKVGLNQQRIWDNNPQFRNRSFTETTVPYLTFSERVREFLKFPTVNLCHASGDTNYVVDQHQGPGAHVSSEFKEGTQIGVNILQEKHPLKDLFFILEYGLLSENIIKSMKNYTPQVQY